MSEKDMLGGSAAGPLKDFAEKLGGKDGEQWFEAFKRFLRKEDAWPRLQVWMTINLGTGLMTLDNFHRALRDGGFSVSSLANDILDTLAFAESIARAWTTVDLCKETTAQLTGKKEGGTVQEVFAGIKRFGGALCPAEVGPQLCLQYMYQPNCEHLLIAMNSVSVSGGDPCMFVVERYDSKLRLYAYRIRPDSVVHPDVPWVFVRPPWRVGGLILV